MRNAFPWIYLGLVVAQAAHSIEEVTTSLWVDMGSFTAALHSHIPLFPHVAWSREGFTLANLAIVALLACLSWYVFRRVPWAWKLAIVVAVLETLNGINHIASYLIAPVILPGGYRDIHFLITSIPLLLISIPLWAIPSFRRLPHGVD